MKNFTYVNAPSKDAALDAMAANKDYLVIAGGTNVMVNIFGRKLTEGTLVDIRNAVELRSITDNGDTVTIGSLTTINDLIDSKVIEKDTRCLWQAAKSFADPTTRNSATIGGNIASASPGGDTLPSLLVLDAVVRIEKAGGSREIPIAELFADPNKNTLAAGELITAVTVKKVQNSCFIKLGLRNSMAISVASVAVVVEKDNCGCNITDARVAMGSVAPTPVRCANAEKAIMNAHKSDVSKTLVTALAKDIKPIDDFRATGKYRSTVAPRLVEKALKSALGCQGGAR
ncbi:MAG: FAD binding domain-containing protein [Bacillota bacterium]